MSICTSNLTSGFIDLATYDELEKYMYGGPDATAYFVRETRKATWFTQVPTVLSRASGTPDYGQTWSVSISRAGDYLLNTWLRVLVPQITNSGGAAGVGAAANSQIGWCQNLAHNLVAECCITFNDLVAARFDSLHLDFWTAFTVPASKQVGYNNMIGNVAAMTQPNTYPASAAQAGGGAIFTGAGANQQTVGPNGGFFLNLPLPFFYARDSGVALPTAALPYNDMRITFTFRPLATLLTQYTNNGVVLGPVGALAGVAATATPSSIARPAINNQSLGQNLQTVQVWAEYAIVSNDERKRMACAPRDILIEQVQSAPLQTFVPAQNNSPNYDVRFSHAIKVLFFAMVNNTNQHSARSCYGTDCPSTGAIGAQTVQVTFSSNNNADPILNTSLIYENTARLATMGSDYYSLVDPYYHGPVIPAVVGLHMYSYSLDFICLDPLGSTNYGKLTNVSMVPVGAARAAGVALANTRANGAITQAQLAGILTQTGQGAVPVHLNNNQTWSFVVTAVNNNIIRISGGALGFPVL